MVGKNTKLFQTYLGEEMHEELRKISFETRVSMSKIIVLCIIQSLEKVRADLMGQEPKNVIKNVVETTGK